MSNERHPSDGSVGALPSMRCFVNCQTCLNGELVSQDLYFSPETGLINPNYYYRTEGIERIDFDGKIVAPGFLELQSNGGWGFHFTNYGDSSNSSNAEHVKKYEKEVERFAGEELRRGVTGFWATVPTVSARTYEQILPLLSPRQYPRAAHLLGAHVEGPFLAPSKAGAHTSSLFQSPWTTSPSTIYGHENLLSTIKLITLAPELPGSIPLISQLTSEYATVVSLGHSAATYEVGLTALEAGARSLTHVFNAMSPLHHRDPGLAGLMGTDQCYYSVIPDGIHLHPATLTLAYRANPSKCILITDSIELAGLPDGIYPGNAQIDSQQRKVGNKVTKVGSAATPAEETLIGSCTTLDHCVRNLVNFSGCNLAEAVRCVTENVANLMGERKRGILEPGRRADFAILNRDGEILETWLGGVKVWSK